MRIEKNATNETDVIVSASKEKKRKISVWIGVYYF